MSFVHPMLLWGLLLATIPIIIYYLMRLRAMRVPWGGTYILERALERVRKHLFIKQLILLALRVLAVALVVLAFARPLLKKQDQMVTGTGVHHYVVVDASYSMNAGVGGETVWEKGTGILEELAASWGRGEQWSLYVMDEDPGWRVEGRTVQDPEQTVEELREVSVQECSVSLAAGLQDVLSRARGQKAEIFLLADDQSDTWEDVPQTLEAAGEVPPLYWIGPEADSRENRAVTRVRVSQERVLSGHPVDVYVAVRNFGTSPVRDVDLELLVDGVYETSRSISVLPGQENETRFELIMDEPGSHAISARLSDDALDFDNSMGAGVEVAESVSVGVLRGEVEEDKYSSSVDFLGLLAKVMTQESRRGTPFFSEAPIEIDGIDWSEDEDVSFDGYNALVVDGSTPLTEERADRLRQFAERGGGLILAADQNVQPADWNKLFEGRGLLPAALGERRDIPLEGENYRSLSLAGVQKPTFRMFENKEGPALSSLRFHFWHQLGEPGDDASQLLLFDDGEPYAVARDLDPGRVILLAAGLNSYKNNLLARPAVYPLVARLLSEAAGGEMYPRSVARDEPVRLRFPSDRKPVAVHLEQKEREPVVAGFSEASGHIVAQVPGGAAETGVASLMVLADGGHSRVWYGIQGERTDSDLRPFGESEMDALDKAYSLTRIPTWQALSERLAEQRRGRELYFAAIVFMLLVLFGEMLMELLF